MQILLLIMRGALRAVIHGDIPYARAESFVFNSEVLGWCEDHDYDVIHRLIGEGIAILDGFAPFATHDDVRRECEKLEQEVALALREMCEKAE